jgi:hypothetical protein
MKEYSAELAAEKIAAKSILPASSELEGLAARCRDIYNNFSRVLQK